MTEKLETFEPVTDMPLDAGIRRYVLLLRAGGVETFESCQGGEGHAFAEPTVRFHGGSAQAYRAFAVAMENGLPVLHLKMSYSVDKGILTGPWWEIVFVTTDAA